MYIIEVLNKETGAFERYELGGMFAAHREAMGAMKMLERLGEPKSMRVIKVETGKSRKKVTDPTRLATLQVNAAKARLAKAKRNAAKSEPPVVQEEVTITSRDTRVEPDTLVLSDEQVAALVASIRPGKPGSGEYVLDTTKLRTGT